MAVLMLLTALGTRDSATATTLLLRIPSAGSGGEATEFGLSQVLVAAGVVGLLLVLAGLVIWRIRSTRSK